MSFDAHVELLRTFLAQRPAAVERIQDLLNAQRKPVQRQDAALLARAFEDCFFTLAAVTAAQSRLRGQLEEAHWASGFRPRQGSGLHNDIVQPAEMMLRAFHLWQRTRWPGRNGRVRYAHTLFDLYLIRHIALLSMRLWDDGAGGADARLAQAQGVLDELVRSMPADQPVLVRDARWLIPLAQSPTTDELTPYFEVAERIAETLAHTDRIEILRAAVLMAGGHLRSQLRHHCQTKGVSLDDEGLLLSSRRSNALDCALLVQALVPLLQAYERAWRGGHGDGDAKRLALADAILQGISADPELFVNRVDLLGPYTMIEHVFTSTDPQGRAVYSSMGLRHIELLAEYAVLIERLAQPLRDDCPRFEPRDGAYSPYGVLYGFASNLIEHMALKTLQPGVEMRFGLADVFSAGDADKLAWVSGWRKLPHIDAEVAKSFDYPQRFAEEAFARTEDALRKHVAGRAAETVAAAGRLFIAAENDPQAGPETSQAPALPVGYIVSSDPGIVAAQQARPYDAAALLHDRQEGYFLVSFQSPAGWAAVTKDLLTDVVGAGRSARIGGLPAAAAEVLRLMCPRLVAR